MNALAILERGKVLSQSGVALVQNELRLSYDAMIASVRRRVGQLLALGLPYGSRAAVLSPNDPTAFCASLGVLAAGMTYFPVSAKNSVSENAEALNRFDCAVLFYHHSLDEDMEVMKPLLSTVRHFIRIGAVSPESDTETFDPLSRADLPEPGEDDIAWLGQSGGTTGVPKGIQLSWRAIDAFLAKFVVELPCEQPIMLVATPMTHAAGMLALPMLARGGCIVIMERFVADKYLDLIARENITTTFLPPTAIYRLLDAPDVRSRDYSSLRHVIYGAAPMSVPRLKEALSIFGPVMTQIYGQSECHTLVTLMRPEAHFAGGVIGGDLASDSRLASCGRPSIGTRIEIRDDDGRVLPLGERGEICVSSDLRMSGYYQEPDETAKVLVDGFVLTGDIGFLDEDGFLYIVDRKKEMVISGGLNIYPSEIERVLQTHPYVAESAVVGLPDADWGEAVAAVVRLRPGHKVTAQDLIAFVKKRVGSVKCPKALHIWGELPRSSVGKILKTEIKRDLIAGRGPSSTKP
jgi:acyl-CoA synthetase (AMP-forming)/AMP-acid ligase II